MAHSAGPSYVHSALYDLAPPPAPFSDSGFILESDAFTIDPTHDEEELDQAAQTGLLIEEVLLARDQDYDTDEEEDDERLEESDEAEDSSESEEEGFAQQSAQTRRKAASFLQRDEEFYPWPDRITCLIDLIMHLPRVNFSHSQAELILFIMRALGPPNVSTKIQAALKWCSHAQKLYGVDQVCYDGVEGHRYYVNNISQILRQEFSNRHVRPHLSFLPEDTYPRLTEQRRASRWLSEYPIDLATPCQRHPESKLDYHTCEAACRGSRKLPIDVTKTAPEVRDEIRPIWSFNIVYGGPGVHKAVRL
ncbi:hypothetical protein NMY22_g15801 [Coprinellus aureogranulatus]|nr:hypothetical protein NMY22_g15801 [Coprinellus aureogranulatus]